MDQREIVGVVVDSGHEGHGVSQKREMTIKTSKNNDLRYFNKKVGLESLILK